MTTESKVAIGAMPTGVPGLDVVLGGGIPEYSLNVVAGGLGTGKTTLVQQIVFANASPERQALVFTALAEPPLKMLRYQQQFSFFDVAKVDRAVRYVSLNDVLLGGDLDAILEVIVREVESVTPALVVIDSFRALVRTRGTEERPDAKLQAFLERLAIALMSWHATTFLVGEYLEAEMLGNPVFIVADGVLWAQQVIEHNAIVRKLQVIKMRGQSPMPGLHTFRVTGAGIEVYPRMPVPMRAAGGTPSSGRVSSGVAILDEMLHGGYLKGDSVLIAGPAGTGKTLLATQFIAAGVARGEHGVIAVFEEQPDRYLARAARVGIDLSAMVEANHLRILYLRPLDLSVDETLHTIQVMAKEVGAQRVVIDSLSGFELAVAPSFREEFRESFYRMIGTLSTVGITVLMTVEVIESFMDLRFSPHAISFLVDDVVLERYVELNGRLERVITVVKMRGSAHDRELRLYDITAQGIQIGKPLRGYRGILTGVPGKVSRKRLRPIHPGLDAVEVGALKTLEALREATVEELVTQGGIDPRVIERALGRLLDLNYAIRASERGRTVYRPVVQAILR